MNKQKRLGLDQIISKMKEGMSPSKIAFKYNIPKQTMQHSVKKLKDLGCIEKVGYAAWKVLKEVPTQPKGSLKGDRDFSIKEIRGHAFIWKIEFVQPYDWEKVIKAYKKKKLTFNLIGSPGRQIPRAIFDGRKTWFTKRGLTIYEAMDFLGKSSFQVKGTAVFEMDRLIKRLLRELGLKFKQYRFTTSREHYGMIKNELARQFNDRKEKMLVRGEDGTAWLWIDDSKGLGELETGEPNVSRQVQNFWNDHKKHGFKMNASVISEGFQESAKQIQKNAEHLEFHAENMRSHVQATRDLSAGIKIQNKLFERIAKALEEKKDSK